MLEFKFYILHGLVEMCPHGGDVEVATGSAPRKHLHGEVDAQTEFAVVGMEADAGTVGSHLLENNIGNR